MAKAVYESLGIGPDGNEYYYDPEHETICIRVPAIREAVQAELGWAIASADYSQIEIRIMAFLSQDEFLIQAINAKDPITGKGLDFHSYMASQVYQMDYDVFVGRLEDPEYADEYALLRSGVKACSFGIPYGAGPNRIAAQIRVKNDFKRFPKTGGKEPMDEALKRATILIRDYLGKAQQLAIWLEEQKDFAVRWNFTRSPRGRIRWYQLPPKSDPEYNERVSRIKRCATNQPIQGGNADVLKLALPRIYKSFREGGKMNGRNLYGGARIMLVVHDEIAITAPLEHIEACRVLLKEAMEWAYAQIAMDFGGDEGLHYLHEINNVVDVTPASDHWIK